MNKGVPWFRVFVEAVVIVTSILLAFGIDSWWQAREDARVEMEYLQAFLLDVERTKQDAEVTAAAQRREVESMRALRDGLASGEVPADTMRSAGVTVRWLEESMDTYRDLVASGGTTRIRSGEVRHVMSRVLSRVNYIHSAQDWALNRQIAMEAATWAATGPISRDRAAGLLETYLGISEVLIDGHESLVMTADSAVVTLQAELTSRR